MSKSTSAVSITVKAVSRSVYEIMPECPAWKRGELHSCICVMELRFGSVLREDFEVFRQRINKEIISRVNIVPLGEKEALAAGAILAEMRKTGQSIGIEDVLIAASAITNQCIMVTGNIRHFSKISGLIVEDWFKAV